MRIFRNLMVVMLVLIGSISFSYGQKTATIASLTQCTVGDSVTVEVNVTDFNAIGAISMKILFNPAVLQFGRTFDWTTGINPASDIVQGSNNTSGNLIVSYTSLMGSSFGSTTLYKIRFKHLGGTSPVIFSATPGDNDITDPDAISYTVTFNNGAVNQGLIPVASITASGSTTFCNGDSVRLNATTDPGFTYQWIKDNVDISGAIADSLWVKDAGSYTLKVTAFCGNITSNTTTVIVNNVPDAAGTITGTANACLNTTGIAYSVPAINGATGYIWTLPTGATIASGTNTNSITVDFSGTAVSGNITVYGTNACGNGTLSSFAVTMNDKPVAAGTITGSNAVCQGTTGVAFSVPTISGASSYTWTLPTGASVATGLNSESLTVDFANNSTSGVLTVKGENLCGFGTVSADYAVTVNGTPDVTVTTTGTTTFCNGDSVKFSVVNDVNYSYAWYEGANLIASETNYFYYAKLAGSYKVAITNTVGGCSKTSTANTVTVNALPTASTTLTAATICSGDSVELDFSLTGTAPYVIVGTDGSGNVNFNAASSPWKTWVKPTGPLTTYSVVSITDANNCTNTSTAATAVTVNPTPTVTITQPAGVCSPTTVDLTASAITNGSTASLVYTYWTDMAATVVYTSPTNAATGTYYIKGSTTLGCYDIESVTVSNNPTPTVNITNPADVCSPATVDLTLPAVTNTSTANLIYTYWTDLNATTSYATPTAATAGTYYIKGATNEGCFTIQPVTVTVNPTPTVVITQPAGVCSPTTVDLTASAITNGSTTGLVYTYWTDAAATITYASPTNAATGKYYIKGTTTLGCFDIDSVVVTNNPTPTVNITNPAAVCSPNTVDLTLPAVTNTSTTNLIYTYWTDINATTTYTTATAATAGTYYIKGATTEGCFAIQPVTVTVNPLPVSMAGSDVALCATSTLNLNGLGGIPTYNSCTSGCTIPTGYCVSGATSIDEYINNFTINGASQASSSSLSSNYTSSIFTTLIAGQTYSAGVTVNASGYTEYVSVFVDWNRNGTFEGNERTNFGSNYVNGNVVFTNNIVVPSTAVLGETMMRVVLRYNAATDSCGTFNYGETEDYKIEVKSMTLGGTVNYTWTGPSSFSSTSQNTSITSMTSAKAGNYVLKTNVTATGCYTTDTVAVVVNALPVATITAATATTFCQGGSVVLNADNTGAGISYQWRQNSADISSATSSNVTATTSGNYKVIVTDANLCKDSTATAVVVTVNPLPVATLTPAGPTTFCQGNSVILNAATATGQTYVWKKGNDTIQGAIAASYTASASGTYKVIITKTATSCVDSTSAPIAVTVNALPTVTLTGLASSYCVDALAATLIGTPANGVFAGVGVSGSTFNPSVAGVGNHSVVYSFTDANNCSAMASQSTNVNALPVIGFTSIPAQCIDATPLTLSNASPIGGTYSGLGVASGNFTASVAGVGTSYIKYSYTDPTTTCTKLDSTTVVVNALPVITITGASSPYCLNAINDTLVGTPALGTFSGAGMTADVFSAAAAGVGSHYIVYTGTDANNCTNKDSVSVTVNTLPVVAITNLAAAYCVNGMDTTILATPAGGTFTGTGMTGSVFKPSTVTAGPVAITYSYTDATTNCTNEVIGNTTVYAAPVVNLGNDTTACVSFMLDAGAGFTNYLWSTMATTQTINVTASGTYIAGVVDNHLCYNTDTVAVTINSLPVFSLGNDTIVKIYPYINLVPGYAPVTLTAPAGMTSYLWSTGATTQTIAVDSTGLGAGHAGIKTIWVKVTNANGCDYTDTININFQDNTGISQITTTNFRVYPNPNKGVFTIEVNNSLGNTEVKLFDVTGKEVVNQQIDFTGSLTKEFDFSHLPKGVYFVRLINDANVNTNRIIIQ